MSNFSWQDELVNFIQTTGAANEETASVKPIIVAKQLPAIHHILDLSSGKSRIRNNIRSRFSLILSQPGVISTLSPFAIRCCLCSNVISYPAWHYVNKLAVNHFHYFICFNGSNEVNTKCYR